MMDRLQNLTPSLFKMLQTQAPQCFTAISHNAMKIIEIKCQFL